MDLLASGDKARFEWLWSHILALSIGKDIQLHLLTLMQN